jgi:hypothetical protein
LAITITYQPDKSISFGDVLLSWGKERSQIRKLLNDNFEISDTVIDLSPYNFGDTSQKIIQRRDIYRNFQGHDNFFFVNFDNEDKFRDIEIHHGLEININGKVINFSMDIDKVAELLDNISDGKKILSDGEYFFKDLKLTIASSEAMGGDGHNLAYFYCSKDVTHLTDN